MRGPDLELSGQAASEFLTNTKIMFILFKASKF